MNFMIYKTDHAMTTYDPYHIPQYVVYRLRFFGLWATRMTQYKTKGKALDYVLRQSKNSIVTVEYRL